jgi:hypothetical protein
VEHKSLFPSLPFYIRSRQQAAHAGLLRMSQADCEWGQLTEAATWEGPRCPVLGMLVGYKYDSDDSSQ